MLGRLYHLKYVLLVVLAALMIFAGHLYTTLADGSPIATDDSFSTAEHTALTVSAPGVLANDSGGAGPLSATLLTAPRHGLLTLNGDGSFGYQPAVDYTGTDWFVYEASDGVQASNPATVTVAVSGVNDGPVVVNSEKVMRFGGNYEKS